MVKHWTEMNPLMTPTNNMTGLYQLPAVSYNTTTYNHIFKYMIGDMFIDNDYGDTFEITGYNYTTKTYQGIITMKLGNRTKTIKTNMIFEGRLNKMTQFFPSVKGVSLKKDKAINYRIYYFEKGKGNKSIQYDVKLSGIRALTKMLNSKIKTHPNRRIIMVAVLDDNGRYVEQVKFLKKEIKEQKFLTGMKERLLAYAKYECGYEVATNF